MKKTQKARMALLCGVVLIFSLFGHGASAATSAPYLSVTQISFGNQTVGTTSAPASVTVSNTTRTSITIRQILLSTTQFSVSGAALPITLSPGQSLTESVRFAPTSANNYRGTLSLERSNGAALSVNLTGSGVKTQAVKPSAPSITSQPISQTINSGKAAMFSVTASGTAPISYQWKLNGTAISGATSSTYTTPAETTANSGASFSAAVSNSAGSVTSTNAVLTVNAVAVAPVITSQPASQTIVSGKTAMFQVAASGTAPLTYQWLLNGTSISGATSSNYTTPAETTSSSGAQIAVVVSNSAGSATSGKAVLTVNAASAGALNSTLSSLSFGNVSVDTSASLSVVLTNAGSSNISVTNITVAGAGFQPSGVPSGLIIGAGRSATLNVAFAPTATGAVSGSVTVASTASDSTLVITLSGTGAQTNVPILLTWDASASSVAGYNVFRSTVSGGSYSQINSALVTSTDFTDATAAGGQTYYYVVTAVSSSDTQSVNSNQAMAMAIAQ